MESHGLIANCTSKSVKAKIVQLMPDDVEFARPYFNRPETILSPASKNAAVLNAVNVSNDQSAEMQVIMNCATIIRRDILANASNKWSFNGSLSNEDRKKHTPISLQMLLKWILQGTNNGSQIQ